MTQNNDKSKEKSKKYFSVVHVIVILVGIVMVAMGVLGNKTEKLFNK